MDIAANRALWGSDYDWRDAGEEWSAAWGGSDAQWHESIRPRIEPYLPAAAILEIAPGHGRWSHYLRDECSRLVLVDVAEGCIRSCQERFAGDDRIEYHVNDGRSLAMIDDQSIDFAFSFDSLVHVEKDVIDDYLRELATKLKPDGVGFIHHSNAGEYRRYFTVQKRLPTPITYRLVQRRLLDFDHWRALSVTAETVRRACESAGLVCFRQELVNWGTARRLIDCFSTFAPSGSRWTRPHVVNRNPDFMGEAQAIRAARAAAKSPGNV